MKKLIIAGSSKLQERAAYWRGYFEGRGYEVIDYPAPVSTEGDYAENLTDIYCSFYQNLDRAEVFFLMNEDKDGFGGYIGPSAFAELTIVVIGNLNRGKKVEIYLLQEPSSDQACYTEVKFWLDQGWVKIYDRPTHKALSKKAAASPAAAPEPVELVNDLQVQTATTTVDLPPVTAESTSPAAKPSNFLSKSNEKTINILTCKKRCLRKLNRAQREYLQVLSPEFPAWLLKYIAAPEFQRLSGVSMDCGVSFCGIYSNRNYCSVFAHSIGVALLLWRFTHDKKQTLAGLLHDIASPAFKHTIDYMNGDAETQESIEERTSEIIRNSRVITRQLKRDGIMPGEVSDFGLFPLADNPMPNLAADRLEYTLSDSLFMYEIWTLDQIRRFSDNIMILHNENGIEELGFRDLEVAKDYTQGALGFLATCHSDEDRAIMQFLADIFKSMMLRDLLTLDDLYAMSEREVADWILSCGDKTISDAFRNFQRATTVYGGAVAKKDRYCTSVKAKVRYVVPLVRGDSETGDRRLTELSKTISQDIIKYLDAKQSKFIGFDFEFTPYTE